MGSTEQDCKSETNTRAHALSPFIFGIFDDLWSAARTRDAPASRRTHTSHGLESLHNSVKALLETSTPQVRNSSPPQVSSAEVNAAREARRGQLISSRRETQAGGALRGPALQLACRRSCSADGRA